MKSILGWQSRILFVIKSLNEIEILRGRCSESVILAQGSLLLFYVFQLETADCFVREVHQDDRQLVSCRNIMSLLSEINNLLTFSIFIFEILNISITRGFRICLLNYPHRIISKSKSCHEVSPLVLWASPPSLSPSESSGCRISELIYRGIAFNLSVSLLSCQRILIFLQDFDFIQIKYSDWLHLLSLQPLHPSLDNVK